MKSLQLCLTLCDPMDCNPPGTSVHEILQARILEWIVISFSAVSSRPRDQTHISCVSCVLYLNSLPLSHLENLRWWLGRRENQARILCSLERDRTCREIPITFPEIILPWERAWMVLQRNWNLFLSPIRKVGFIQRSEIFGERKSVFPSTPMRRPSQNVPLGNRPHSISWTDSLGASRTSKTGSSESL